MPETPPRSRLIQGHRFVAALETAGIINEADRVRRIVIDANAKDVVVMYVERYGDERLIDVATTLNGVEITGIPGPAGPAATPRIGPFAAQGYGCPKCGSILNAKAADCDGQWHSDNQPELSHFGTVRARSCPTCHSIGAPRVGHEDQLCTDSWHD